MSRRNSIILGLLFVILVVEIIVLSPKELGISPADDVPAVSSASQGEGESGQILSDIHVIEAKPDGKEWELWADRALGPRGDKDWTLERVKVRFFAKDGATYTVTGRKGQVAPEKNDIRIEGSVVTRSSNGYVFKTESAFYDSKTRRLTSPSEVEMEGPPEPTGRGKTEKLTGLLLKGSDMVADLSTNEITVNRDVRAKKELRGNRTALIKSDRALFSGRSNQAKFRGDVVIDVETMRISGPEASFSYDGKTKAFQSVEIGGGVKMTDTNKFATSQSVSVNLKDDKLVFSGTPRVVHEGDEIVGDEIVFLEGGKKVLISNAKAQIDPNVERLEKRN